MNDHRDKFDRDDVVRAWLHAIDPAASMLPASPTRVARLLEDTMNADTASPTTRRRNPFTWVAAAAAAVLVAGVGFGAATHHSKGVPEAATLPSVSRATGTLDLSLSGHGDRCVATPTVAQLAKQDVAFQGTVTAIKGGYVYLHPASFFAGKQVETVKVKQPVSLVSEETVSFKVGQSYLVSATNGVVSACGFSGVASSGLSDLYHQAFS